MTYSLSSLALAEIAAFSSRNKGLSTPQVRLFRARDREEGVVRLQVRVKRNSIRIVKAFLRESGLSIDRRHKDVRVKRALTETSSIRAMVHALGWNR